MNGMRPHAWVVVGLTALGGAQQEPAAAATAPPALAPVQQFALDAAVPGEVRWIDDVLEFARTLPAFAAGPTPDLDLARHAALLVPAALPPGQRLTWRRAQLRDGEWRIELQLEPLPTVDDAEPVRQHGAVFVVPRVAATVRVLVPIADGRPVAALRMPAPDVGEVPKVLAVRTLATGGGEAPRCLRAATPAEWRELREGLGDAGKDLPDDIADFARQCVVLVAPARTRAFPGFRVAASTEEGVDVLTVTQRLPSGRELPEIAQVLLLVLPQRPHQLAVVAADNFGSQSMSTVFEPLR